RIIHHFKILNMEQLPKTTNQAYRDNLAKKLREERAAGNIENATNILDHEKKGIFYEGAQTEHREGSQLEARQQAFANKIAAMKEQAAKLGLEISVDGLPETPAESTKEEQETVSENKTQDTEKDVFSKMDQEVVDDLIQHENQKSETDSEKYIRLEKEREAKLATIGIDNALDNVADTVQETPETSTKNDDELTMGEELLQKTENLTTPNFVAQPETVVEAAVAETTKEQSKEEKLAAAIIAANAAAKAAEKNSATRSQAGAFRSERNKLAEQYQQETGRDFYTQKSIEEKEDKKKPKGFLAGLFNRNKGLKESSPKGDGFLKRNWKKVGLAAGLLFLTMPSTHTENASRDTITDDIENTRDQERKERLQSSVDIKNGDGVTQIMKRVLDMNESMLHASGLSNTSPETMKSLGENLYVIDKKTGEEIRLTEKVIGGKALVSYDKENGFSLILNVDGKMIDARLEGVGVGAHNHVDNYEYAHNDAKVTQTSADTVTINNLYN
ncbi:MAG: hypothetical protein ACPGTS_01180, partial [Minisyncoccia bacterium]